MIDQQEELISSSQHQHHQHHHLEGLLRQSETKLQEFIGKVVNEWGAAEGTLITFAGERLGLFKAMAGAGELTPEELAKRTRTHPRIIKEWLTSQAAGGFVTYNQNNDKYSLSL